jgi:hypothetical protein
MIASAFMTKAQPVIPPAEECSELFITEMTFGKAPKANNLFDLNYAIEIFNPSQSPIDLVNYSLDLTNGSNNVTSIPLSGMLAPGDVYVVCNDNADLNLKGMSDQLSPALDFENNVILELKRNGNVIDRIGQIGTPTNGGLNFAQLLADPYNYLLSFHLDLNDYNNIDIRRGLFVTQGDPNFSSATDVIGKWGYFFNVDRSDIGQHHCLCNKPAGIDYIGYKVSSFDLIANSTTIDPLDLNVNGQTNGSTFTFLPSMTQSQIQGTGKICNNGSIPFPELKWLGGQFNPCQTNTWDYQFGVKPQAQCEIFSGNTAPTWCLLQLSSNNSDVDIDFASNTHRINIKFPLGTSDIDKDVDFLINPNYTYSDLNIHSSNIAEYSICDLQGQQMSIGLISNNTSSIFTSNLSQGIYIISMKSSKGKVYTQKFTKL